MSNLLQKKEKGFTLIEIVLVLAIAGLILVIVFLAVSGAQKSRRDTQRKDDVSRVAAALENYASNNDGNYPATGAFSGLFSSGGNYDLKASDPLTGTSYTYGTGTTPTVPSGSTPASVVYTLTSPRVYSVCIGLEQGTKNCRSNQ